jgi:hypothetical protein
MGLPNMIAMQFGDNDVRLTIGHQLDLADAGKGVVQEVGVFVTPRSAKIMMVALKCAIAAWDRSRRAGRTAACRQGHMATLISVAVFAALVGLPIMLADFRIY